MIETGRLLIRSWRDADVAPFHAMNTDPEVIRFLYDEAPDLAESRASVERLRSAEVAHGQTFWALERRDDGGFIGFCGIKPGPAGTPIADEPEIGWRLARAHWRQGFAAEAAAACLTWGWANGMAAVAAITVPVNERSRRLMDRLGMTRDGGSDFNHPALPPGHRLSRHLTYRIARPVQ